MNTQPEALRLADELIELHGYPLSIKAAAELRRLHELNQELQNGIDSIYVYSNDTLSGRTDGADDRNWQREGVVEIRNRARVLATVEGAIAARAALAKASGSATQTGETE